MTVTETREPRSVLSHRRGLIPTRKEGTRIVSQPTALLNPPENPDGFNEIVAAYSDDTYWEAIIDLKHEPLTAEEIDERERYVAAVPGVKPWGATAQIFVVGDMLHISRRGNPLNGFIADADEGEEFAVKVLEAVRRARRNQAIKPKAA